VQLLPGQVDEELLAPAECGSTFLNEIDTLSPPLQAKLLRVAQQREFEPGGATRAERGRMWHARMCRRRPAGRGGGGR
jgi:transcriptional regulator with AAA-type ATPase domain